MPEFAIGTFTIGSLLGIVLGALIGHALAVRRGKDQVKHNASLELKKAFHPTILKLSNGENPTIIIEASFHKHQEAAMDFSGHLESTALHKYNEAFNEYVNWYKVVCNRSRSQKIYDTVEPKYLSESAKDPVKLITNILNHANT